MWGRGSRFSPFSWEIKDKFYKFGTFFLILFINKSILLPVNGCQIAGSEAKSEDPDQTPPFAASDLGLHCCSGLSKYIE